MGKQKTTTENDYSISVIVCGEKRLYLGPDANQMTARLYHSVGSTQRLLNFYTASRAETVRLSQMGE